MPDEIKSLGPNDFKEIGEFVKQEKERRKARRTDRERIWKEIDRQIAMTPLPRIRDSGGNERGGSSMPDWYPELEPPSQFNTLEVLAADARRLKFPRGTSWFEVSSELSDDYLERFEVRRWQGTPIGEMMGIPPGMPQMPMIGDQSTPIELDQETADTLVKATLDNYHRLYDFRGQMDLLDAEAIKYGTFVGRVVEMSMAQFHHDYRGVGAEEVRGPALVPCSIKNVYLDDSAWAVAQEGVATGPSFIRCYYQNLDDLKRAARVGGSSRGWMPNRIKNLEPLMGDTEHRGQVELLEFEGDLIVPKNRNSLFLPNVRVTVAVGNNAAEPVRFRTNPDPFRSYVVGHYMRDDVLSPYGSSPLMKGQPLAEAVSQVLNDLMAASLLNTQPPISWDRSDPTLAANGGPLIYPGVMWGADSPDSIVVHHQIGRPQDLMQVYLALVKQYEDTTGVNDPRRGAEVKSHTTAYHMDVQSTKGMSRTDDFVQNIEKGPLTSVLYMQYAIAKRTMKKPTSIPVDANGIDGWVTVDTNDLPDRASFLVNGSAGVLMERERNENFLNATKFAVELSTASLQMASAAQQMGVDSPPVFLDLQQLITEGYTRAGVPNPARFIIGIQGAPVGPPALPGLPPAAPGINGTGQAPGMEAGM